MSQIALIACPDCDLLVSLKRLPRHVHANCPRCGHQLYDNRPHRLDHLFALAFTGLILWFPSTLLPLLQIRLLGHELNTTIIEASLFLMISGYWFVGALVLFTGAIAPLVTLSLMLWILLGAKRSWPKRSLVGPMKWLGIARRWTMIEIYLISFLVALFKLKDYAEFQLGFGFISYLALFVVQLFLAAQYNRHYMWHLIDRRQPHE